MSPVIPWTAGKWAPIGRCSCGVVVSPDSFRDRASYLEATEQQLQCQDCQDRLFFARSEDGDLGYPIRRGVVAAPNESDGVVHEIGLLRFIFVAPEYRIAWEPRFLLRAGMSLAPVDPWQALEPMRQIFAGHQVRLEEVDDVAAPEVRAAFDVDLVVVMDEDAAAALSRLPFTVSAPVAVMSRLVHWTVLRSSALLAPWLGDSGADSVLRRCALSGMVLDPGAVVEPLRFVLDEHRELFPELSWESPDVAC